MARNRKKVEPEEETEPGRALEHAWAQWIPDEQWAVYRQVIQAARARRLSFALGGAFAVATYTGFWRNTKDLDLYVLPQDREAAIEVVTSSGLSDYYEQQPYDRSWIYRSHREGVIVDIIWAMANQARQIDRTWFKRGPEVEIRGEAVRILPAEEMIWAKLYVMQKERCDWPDALNIIYTRGANLDWGHLFDQLGQDAALLRGLMAVFAWMCPGRARILPEYLWQRLQIPAPSEEPAAEVVAERVKALDSRPWFGPLRREEEG
jgi:hypothetical protein